MLKKLWIQLLLLMVVVVLVGLSGAFLLRELMVQDFRAYLEDEMEDRVYWLAASLETSYATHGGWEAQDIMDSIVLAAMMGIDMKVYNVDGELISDTEAAFNSLTPIVKERVLDFYDQRVQDAAGEYAPYELSVRGERFGRIDARVLPPKTEAVFIEGSNRLLALSVLIMGGIAIILSIVFSRKVTRPVEELTEAAANISEGNFTYRVRNTRDDEVGTLSTTFNRMAENLVTQEKLRRKLTANVAHELRTPISAIRGELEGMLDGYIELREDTLRSLYAEVGRLKNILDGIEDLSQAEASSLNISKKKVELEPFLNGIVERYRKGFSYKGVALELLCGKGVDMNVDPDKLSQVVINLLDNALKATDEGGRVTVSARREGDGVRLEFADTGSGIREEDLPFIFERFYRASEGGLGLGLTIVKELVEAHGGTIDVRSEEGKGTTFIVSLPG